MKTNYLQHQIFSLINGIEISEKAKKRFFDVIAVIYGSKSEAYQDFEKLIANPEKQFEMLKAPDNHKYKNNFMVFCRIAVKSYMEQELSRSSENSTGFSFYNYLAEIEKAVANKPGIAGFGLQYDIALNAEEDKLTFFLLSQQAESGISAAGIRKILSIWLMYPELICNQNRAENVVKSLRSANRKI